MLAGSKLTRREGRALDIAVDKKQTHTDRYLHFHCPHPVSAKRAAIRSLFDRTRNVTLQENLARKSTSPLL